MTLKGVNGYSLEVGTSLHGVNLTPDDTVGYVPCGLGPIIQLSWLSSVSDSQTFFGSVTPRMPNLEIEGLPPMSVAYDHLSDYARYSFPLGELMRQSSRSGGKSAAFDQENQVHHLTISGTVRPHGSGVYSFSDRPFLSGSRWETTPDHRNEFTGQTKVYGITSAFPFDGDPVWCDNVYAHADLSDTLQALHNMWRSSTRVHFFDNPLWPQVIPLPYQPFNWRGFSDFVKTGPWSATWTEYYLDIYGYVARTHYEFSVGTYSLPVDAIPDSSGKALFGVSVTSYASSFTGHLGGLGGPLPGTSETSEYDLEDHKTFDSQRTFMLSRPTDIDLSRHPLFTGELLKKYGEECGSASRLLRPSANLVLADLLSEIEQQSANWIEFFAEFDEIFELFPKEQLLLVLKAVQGGSLSTRLRNISKAVAGGYLAYSFSWRPLLGAPDEASLALSNTADKWDSLKNPARFRVSRRFEFDAPLGDSFTRSPTSLTTRLGVTVGGFDDRLTRDALRLDAAGVFPRPSRFWATTKASFLVDFFHNVSGRMEVIEAYVLMHLLDPRDIVASYTSEYVLTSGELFELGLEAHDTVTIQYYVREKSVFVPALFNAATAALFFEPKPNWTIIFALIVSFLT